MLSTLPFDWNVYFSIMEKELGKLAVSEESKRELLAAKIADNISKVWAALFKEINYAKHILECDQASERDPAVSFLFSDPEIYNETIGKSEAEHKNLIEVQKKLVSLKNKWETATGKKFAMNKNYNHYHTGLLEGQLLFKDYKKATKISDSDPARFDSLVQRLALKRQEWTAQLEDLQVAIRANNLNRRSATSIGHVTKAQQLTKNIEKLTQKLNKTGEFLKLVEELSGKVETNNHPLAPRMSK